MQHVAHRGSDPATRTVKSGHNRDRVASDMMVSLVQKFANLSVTPNEAKPLARAAYAYADALIAESEVVK